MLKLNSYTYIALFALQPPTGESPPARDKEEARIVPFSIETKEILDCQPIKKSKKQYSCHLNSNFPITLLKINSVKFDKQCGLFYAWKRYKRNLHCKPGTSPAIPQALLDDQGQWGNVIKLQNYYTPEQRWNNMAAFIYYYNTCRYHESLDNLKPAHIYFVEKSKS